MINPLERRAKGGNLLPAFQLYQQYEQSENGGVLDKQKAREWFDRCWHYLQEGQKDKSDVFRAENAFYLRSLTLLDFRRFSHLEIYFEPHLTVLIGENGQGKTSVAIAIAKTLSWFSANIQKEDGIGLRLSESTDIRNDSEQKYTDINTQFYFGQGLKNIPVRLSRTAAGVARKRESEIKELKDFSDIWRIVNYKKTVNLPLFAFYSVERSYPLKRKHIEHFRTRNFYPQLTFDWSNLFGSCGDSLKHDGWSRCGIYKDNGAGDYQVENLIKPDEDDPDFYLRFLTSGSVRPRENLTGGDLIKATETIRVFNLNGDSVLFNSRRQTINASYAEIEQFYKMQDVFCEAEWNALLKEEIYRVKDEEFSTALTHAWRYKGNIDQRACPSGQ